MSIYLLVIQRNLSISLFSSQIIYLKFLCNLIINSCQLGCSPVHYLQSLYLRISLNGNSDHEFLLILMYGCKIFFKSLSVGGNPLIMSWLFVCVCIYFALV